MKSATLPIALPALFSVLIAFAQTSNRPEALRTGTVSGVVVTLNDHQPIPQALVTLSWQVGRSPSIQRSVMTNDKGEFAFTGVPFAMNWIDVKKEGFLCQVTEGLAADCGRGANPNMPIELTMLPEAIVTGRVVDQQGRPIPNLELDLLRREAWSPGGIYLWGTERHQDLRTDANGVFRISKLAPGTYALHVPAAYDPPMWQRDEKGFLHFHLPHYGYADTYYPGVLNWKKAKPLVIHAGDEVTANLTVRREPVQPVTLNYRGDFRAEYFFVRDSTESAGLYEDDVSHPGSGRLLAPPGNYKARLILDSSNSAGQSFWVSAHFTVRNRPIVINNIPVQQAVKINLPVHVQTQLTRSRDYPQAPYIGPSGISLELQGEGDGLGILGATARLDRIAERPETNLEFKGVAPGRYIFRLTGDGAYLASLRCGSQNLLREPLVLRPGRQPRTVEAVLRDDFASVSVDLAPRAQVQLPADVQLANFALIPLRKACEYPVFGSVFRHGQRPEPQKFHIPPGTYMAVLYFRRSLPWREPGFRKQLGVVGRRVTLAPEEDQTLSLDFSPAFNFWSLGFGDVP